MLNEEIIPMGLPLTWGDDCKAEAGTMANTILMIYMTAILVLNSY